MARPIPTLSQLYLGIAWRAALWSVVTATAVAAVYTAAFGVFLIPLEATFIPRFAAVGAELGAIAGAIAAVVTSAALIVLTHFVPPWRVGSQRYVAAVQRTASLTMLACGAVAWLVLGLVTLTLAGFIVFIIPTLIAVRLAHRFSPHAVLWFTRRDGRYVWDTVGPMSEKDRTAEDRADRQAAPDSSAEGIDESVESDEEDTVTRKEESSVGPGAGNAPVVNVTAPVQRESDDVTKHPTLREEDPKGQ